MTADAIIALLAADPALASTVRVGLREVRSAAWELVPLAGQRGGPHGNVSVPGWICVAVSGRRVGFSILGSMWADIEAKYGPRGERLGPPWGRHPACSSDASGIAQVSAALEADGWTIARPA